MRYLVMYSLACLLSLFAVEAWAATYYIDTDCAYQGDGTGEDCAGGAGQEGAYNDPVAITMGSGNTYLFRRGRVKNLGGNIFLNQVQDVTIGSYGSGARPVLQNYTSGTTSWTQEGSTNKWSHTFGVNAPQRQYLLLGFDDILTYGERRQYCCASGNVGACRGTTVCTAPVDLVSQNQWDFQYGNGVAIHDKLFIYSTTNPTTRTFYWTFFPTLPGAGNGGIFGVFDAHNVTISDIDFQLASVGIWYKNTSAAGNRSGVTVERCGFSVVYYGVLVDGHATAETSGVEVAESTFSVILGVPVGVFNLQSTDSIVKSSRVHHNTFVSTGISESAGAVYLSGVKNTLATAFEIDHNTSVDHGYGKYYLYDGGAFYTDTGTQYAHVDSNNVYGAVIGLHDNSGFAGRRFTNNIVWNSGFGFYYTDSLSVGAADTVVAGNTFALLSSTYQAARPDTLLGGAGGYGGVTVETATATNRVYLTDNIITGNGVANPPSAVSVYTPATLVETNNNFYLTTGLVVNKATGAAITPSAGSFQADPMVVAPASGNFRLKANSPLRRRGAAVSGLVKDYSGAARPAANPDIGAYQAADTVSSRRRRH